MFNPNKSPKLREGIMTEDKKEQQPQPAPMPQPEKRTDSSMILESADDQKQSSLVKKS